MLFLRLQAEERDFSLFQNVETGSAVKMGAGDPQGVKRPGHEPDLSPSPSAEEETIPIPPSVCLHCFQSTDLPTF